MRLIVNSVLFGFLGILSCWRFVLLNSDELCQSVMLIQKQTDQKRLKLCVKSPGKKARIFNLLRIYILMTIIIA